MSAIQSEEIPRPAQFWLQTVLGGYRVLSAHRANSHRTGVWQLHCSNQRYFFKLHYDRLVWHSEVYAYQQWVSAYEPYVPKLIAVFEDEDLQGLLITAIAGTPLKDSQLDETMAIEVYRQAGRLCKRLHELPAGSSFGLLSEQGVLVNYQGVCLGASASDPVAFIRNNFIELQSQAQTLGGIESDELAKIEQALEAMEVFRREVPTVVNTDYTPGNWLVDQAGRFVGVIDLEHVFRNVMIDAFTRLVVANYPQGTYAFFDGFGSNPLFTRLMQCRIVCLRHALYYIGYGMKSNNKNWVKRGKEIFRQLEYLVHLLNFQ
jgi:aminoglycoside phosphotransferase